VCVFLTEQLQDNIQSEITDTVFGVWIIFFEGVISA
jgi:hypothetical protein